MALLSILYGQTKVVINDSGGSYTTGFKGLINKVKRNVLQEIGMYGGIVLDCTLSEDHTYQADVTENPIEDGSVVADHVNLKPIKLKIDGLVSDSPLGFALIGSAQNAVSRFQSLFGTQSRAKDAFDQIVKLWKNRIPFTVITNLKRYENMVISNAQFPFTSETGHGLDLKLELTQVSIVKSKLIAGSGGGLFSGITNLGSQITSTVEAGSTVQSDLSDTSSILYKTTIPAGDFISGYENSL